MLQIKKHVENKFIEIELKIQEIPFLQNLDFLLEFFGKIQEIEFLCCNVMDFLTQVVLFGKIPFIM